MNVELIREYCIAKPETTESFPFDDDTLVFKTKGKIFAMVNLTAEPRLSLKCDPELAIEIRERYPSVEPGYHMNKRHWNTIRIDGNISNNLIYEWINHSFELVMGKKKSKR